MWLQYSVCHGNAVARELDWLSACHWFDSLWLYFRVATMDKLFTRMVLSPSSIIWYWPKCSDAVQLGS